MIHDFVNVYILQQNPYHYLTVILIEQYLKQVLYSIAAAIFEAAKKAALQLLTTLTNARNALWSHVMHRVVHT